MNRHIKNKKKFKEKMINNNLGKEYKVIDKKRKKLEKNKEKRNVKHLNRINELLELPEELIDNKCKITILDFNKVFIENYINIIKYEVDCVEITILLGTIIISGFELKVNEMNNENIMVEGKISFVELKKDNRKDI